MTAKNTLAQQLLDAHVAHILKRVDADNLPHEAEKLVDQLLAFAGKIKLGDIVSKKDIAATAIFYAADMDIAPAIPELVAEIARELYHHKAHDKATLNDLISDHDFADLLGKVAEMNELRERIVHEAVGNPVYAALVSDLLYNGITRYLNDNPLTKNIPGAKSMLKLGKSMMEKASPNLEAGLKHYIKANTRSALRESERFLLAHLSNDKLIAAATQVWDKIKGEPVSRFRDFVQEDDVEEFFVIGFEFWRSFRQTGYYSDMITAGVDFFFKKYGKTNLKKLLQELGVERDMILTEAMRYAPRIVAELNKHGFIEQLARAQLADFYASAEVTALLDAQ